MGNRSTVAMLAILMLAVDPAPGQTPYRRPPEDIVALIDVPPPPLAVVSPARNALLLVESEPNPPIAFLAAPVLRLAGVRIDPKAGVIRRLARQSGLLVCPLDGCPARRVELPGGTTLRVPSWSPDGRRIAFALDGEAGEQLWVAEGATGRARAIASVRLNDVLGNPIVWLDGGRRLLARVVPQGRGPAPEPPRAPSGPNVQESDGRRRPSATYQDLLANPHDEDLFEHFATSQLARIDVEGGRVERIGPAGLITDVEPSPDGAYLLVSQVRRPFSYRVPFHDFARTTEVWDALGRSVATVADLPIADDVPRQGVPRGTRGIHWQSSRGARLVWAEALDGGDPRAQVPHRDRLLVLAAPFTSKAEEILKLAHRFDGLAWLPDRDRALVTEHDRDRRWRTTFLADLATPNPPRKVVFDLSVHDAYGDPGIPWTVTRTDGSEVVLLDGDGEAIYLAGQGAAPAGARPFLDRRDLKTGQTTRLFHCREGAFESVLSFVGNSPSKLLVRTESKVGPPNYRTVDLEDGTSTRLTHFQDPAPRLSTLKKELITYRRADGLPLSGTLYLPADYEPGKRLPLLIWAYPRDYSDPGTAGQVRTSPHRFTLPVGASPVYLALRGYAVLDEATMPVVGDPESMNDTYVEQIVAAARAAIETLDARGIIDPRRVGIGGHSYGAFMTANLLAHSDLFAAGIARSGAYNRSLTPFGFQSERRSYWEATGLYTRISPFTYADKINEPILLIHGEADENPGTFPTQSERLFQAIKGNGGRARLVLLPHEGHGYRARESVLHALAEMLEWADRFVKEGPGPARPATSETSGPERVEQRPRPGG